MPFNFSYLLYLILFLCILSCQPKQEKMHQFCGSSFCSLEGSRELQKLLILNQDSTTPIFNIQIIDAANRSDLHKKLIDIENELNYSLKKANIRFKVNKHIEVIDNKENIDTIFKHNIIKNKLLKKYNSPNAINIYIVPAGTDLNGYTHVLTSDFDTYPSSIYNYMFINEKAIFNGNTIQHEMGHFFGLQHTFGKTPLENSTDEKPDGSNCLTTGDFICDTPADPNGKIDKNCTFLGLSNGSSYAVSPDVSNFMSYYHPICKMNFTSLQCLLIHNFANQYRSYLIK
jgi:hypothetical protein